jgi:hypothetical protein
MTTSRNTRGIDIVIVSQGGKKLLSVQVKALSKAVTLSAKTGLPTGKDVGVGSSESAMLADYYVIVSGVDSDATPRTFVLKKKEAAKAIVRDAEGGQMWLDHKRFGLESNLEAWDKFGRGDEGGEG